jgi:hypothetical protein
MTNAQYNESDDEEEEKKNKTRKKRLLLSRLLLHPRASPRKKPQVMIVTLMIRLWLF